MSDRLEGATPHGYNPPGREKVDCERCGGEEVVVFVERSEPALCDDCEKWVASLDAPQEDREITPMDRRWR